MKTVNAKKIFLKYLIRSVSCLYIVFTNFTRIRVGSDQFNQLATARNFLNNKGFVLSYFDGNQIYDVFLWRWPYLYRVISLPFLLIFKNPEISFLMIRVLAIFFLIFSLSKIFKILFCSKGLASAINYVFLSVAFCSAPFGYGSEIDLISAALFLLLISYSYDYFVKSNNKKSIFILFILSILIINSRYAYLPIILLYGLFFIAIDLYKKTFLSSIIIKSILAIIISLNVYILISNPYFSSSVETIIDISSSGLSLWSIYYSILINAFFPDITLISFLFKFFGQTVLNNYLFFVVFYFGLSLFLFIYLVIITKKTKFKKEKKNLITLILIAGGSNLISLFFVFGLDAVIPFSVINNIELLKYESLSSTNRYLVLFYISTYIIVLYFLIEHRKTLLKVLLFSSIIFGLCHSIYLSNIYSFSRVENMNVANNPSGSYKDCQEMNEFFILESDAFYKQLFEINSDNYRQINPTFFAKANGLVIFKEKPESDITTKKNNLSENFRKIYYCDFTKNHDFNKNIYKCVYLGEYYSLYLNKPKEKAFLNVK